MAIGISELFGLPIHENFNFPYISRSATEFWRRWHISLSTWVGDYLYSFTNARMPQYFYGAMPLLVTWLIMGIWHGASWRFAVWGAINGLYIVVHRLYKDFSAKHPSINFFSYSIVSWAFTNLGIMCSWIYFRAVSWDQANNILRGLLNPSANLTLRENYYIFVFLFGVGALLSGVAWENKHKIPLVNSVIRSEAIVFIVTTACLALGLLYKPSVSIYIFSVLIELHSSQTSFQQNSCNYNSRLSRWLRNHLQFCSWGRMSGLKGHHSVDVVQFDAASQAWSTTAVLAVVLKVTAKVPVVFRRGEVEAKPRALDFV